MRGQRQGQHNISRLLSRLIPLMLALCFIVPYPAESKKASAFITENPFSTYSQGPDYSLVRTQDAYNAAELIRPGITSGEDMVVYGDKIYIADAGDQQSDAGDNKVQPCIKVCGMDGTVIARLGIGTEIYYALEGGVQVEKTRETSIFTNPKGLYILNDEIYVADKGAKQIFVLDMNGAVLRTIGRPASPLLGAATEFVPVKIVVDKARNIYITSEGSVNGAIHLDENGEFMNFVGHNKTPASLGAVLRTLFYSKEQKERLFKKAAPSPDGIEINSEGFIYTVTNGAPDGAVKLLNTMGTPIESVGWEYFSKVAAMDTDDAGIIYTVDDNGYITIYDQTGSLLFVFAGKDSLERFGTLQTPAAIVVLPDKGILVLDRGLGAVMRYEPTDFFLLVAGAVKKYKEGLYLEGEEEWNEILRLNSSFIIAYRALAQANMKKGNYDLALQQFKTGESKSGYSDAYWYIRNDWMQRNVLWILIAAISLAAIAIVIAQLKKRTKLLAPVTAFFGKIKRNKTVSQLLYSFYYMRHPFKAIDNIKYKDRVSALTATILYILYFALCLIGVFCTGYIFRTGNAFDINLMRTTAMIILPLLLGVVSNYFVSSVSSGEGKFKHVYIAAIYSLTPFIVFSLISVLLSNVLTYNEEIIYSAFDIFITLYCAVLLIASIYRVHNYGAGGTFKNILLTAFTFVMAVVFAVLLYLLLMQLVGFLSTIFKEFARL